MTRKHFYIHKGCGGRVTKFDLWVGTCEKCKKKVHYKQCIHEMREIEEQKNDEEKVRQRKKV